MQVSTSGPRSAVRGCLIAAAVSLAISASQLSAVHAAESDAAEISEVTVTGSRIVRRDLDAASPVVTVENRVFEESSTLAVESVLNQLPQFVPANTQFNTSDVFPSATSTPGISTVSLRGLGAQRTLVLVDGRRAQPVNSTLVIDTNSIPSSALESVEIISGGASATYGADALAGVTNFKLRDNFEGMDLQLRSGITERGDGEEHRASILLGSKVAEGRGNVLLGMEWTQRGEVLAIDRPFYADALKDPNTSAGANGRMNGYQYAPSTTNMSNASRTAFQNAANALFPRSTYTQLPANYVVPIATEFNFNSDGTLYKRERAGLGFKGDIVNDPNYKITPGRTLIQTNRDLRYSSPLERYSLFGKGTFAINDHISAFSQVNFVNSETKQVLQPTGAVGAGFGGSVPHGTATYGPSLGANNQTLPEYQAGGSRGLNCPATGGCTNSQAFPVSPQLAALLDARGPDVFAPATATAANPNPTRTFDPVTGREIPVQGANANWTFGATTDFLPARTIINNTNLFQLLGGFKGDLGLGDWTWEAYISHGGTRTDLDYVGFLSTRRFQAVAQAPNFGKGLTLTGPGSTTLTCTSGLPVFQQFAISEDCIKAITGTYTDRTRLTQDIVEATAQGKIIDLPAGELRGAGGVTRRTNQFEYLPDAIRESNNINDMIVGAFGQANVRGETEVKEIYGEVLVPLLRDAFLAKSLELELGYRYSEYDNGGVATYKALTSWAPLDWVRFRGGYQLANRAPNINELYLDASSTAVTLRAADYCQSTTAERTGNRADNPNRAAVQALCTALIGNTTTPFSADPNNFQGGRTDGVMLQISRGNTNLDSEEGKTWTLGTVLRSPFAHPLASNMTVAVDWYKVKINDAIALVTAQTAYDLCFNRDGTSNPTFSINDPNGACANISRDATTGVATNVTSTYANAGTIETSGLDLTFNWRAALADMGLSSVPGNLSAEISFNKTFDYKAQEFKGGPTLENVGTLGTQTRGALFDWRTVTTLRYSNGDLGVGLNWRHLPSIRSNTYVTDPSTTTQGAGSYDIFGLTGDWSITGNVSVSGGVDNLFDRDPERTGAGQVVTIANGDGGGTTVLNGSGSTTASYYDVLGRRYFLNLKLRF